MLFRLALVSILHKFIDFCGESNLVWLKNEGKSYYLKVLKFNPEESELESKLLISNTY